MRPAATPPDADTLARAIQGEREAFARLVAHYWGRLFRWLRNLTGCAATAEDVTQEAFLRAWKGLDTFRPGADFRVWLFGIARNTWLDAKKGPRGRRTLALPVDLPGGASEPPRLAEENELRAGFEQALARLSEAYREPFLLWFHEGLSFAEVAAVCGLTEATARWRVFRARHRLMEILETIRGEPLR